MTENRRKLPELYSKPVHTCSICNAKNLKSIGQKDFGVSCNDFFEGRPMFEPFGLPVDYYLCDSCGFIFTPAFDSWTHADFQQHIYNADYILTDPHFESVRPRQNAQLLDALFTRQKETSQILDFGGGSGLLAEHLRDCGFNASSYDKYHGDIKLPDNRWFDLITSFEVIEHVPHFEQHSWMSQMTSMLDRSCHARIVLSSETLRDGKGFDWWYIAPRNGHISIHSDESLRILAKSTGFVVTSISSTMHLLSRASVAHPSPQHDEALVA